MTSLLHDSPLRERHARCAADEAARAPVLSATERPGAATGQRRAIDVEYLPYSSPDGALICELVAAFGPVEPEYAAIRRGSALFDAPQIGTVEVRGGDRRDFLQRMLTQDLKPLGPGKTVESFWLNRKGRVDADLVIADVALDAGERLVIGLDAARAAATVEALAPFVFSEDVAFTDATSAWHWLELHGPAAGRMLALAGATSIPARGEARATTIASTSVLLVRDDALGEHGWRLGMPRERASDVWDAIVGLADPHDPKRRVRPIGWNAYNVARIEAGTPRFLIDFGPSNLPHETGLLERRVSFTKGCYLGQEVVARMESLGKPKQLLVGLRPARDLLPIAGAQVFERTGAGEMGMQIGTITSSTLAPMLGAMPVAFAMIKTQFADAGTIVLVNAEGEQCDATVGPLRSLPDGGGR